MEVQQKSNDINERHTLEITLETTMTTNAWYARSHHLALLAALFLFSFVSRYFSHTENAIQ